MLRCATVEEIPRIRDIAMSHGLFDYGTYIYRKLISNKLVHVIEQNSTLVGYVIAFPIWNNTAFCLQIGVSKSKQNNGIGTELMLHVHNLFKNKTLYAHTLKDKSFNYFTTRLGYQSVIRLGPLRVIRKVL